MKSFLTGKKKHDEAPLRPPHSHRIVPPTGTVRPAKPNPDIDVIKEGDKVVRLVVTCSCGERIEIDCLYPAGH